MRVFVGWKVVVVLSLCLGLPLELGDLPEAAAKKISARSRKARTPKRSSRKPKARTSRKSSRKRKARTGKRSSRKPKVRSATGSSRKSRARAAKGTSRKSRARSATGASRKRKARTARSSTRSRRKRGGKREATRANFTKTIRSYLAFHVRRLKKDAEQVLTRQRKRWVEKACRGLEGNPIARCNAWYDESRRELVYRFKPERARQDALKIVRRVEGNLRAELGRQKAARAVADVQRHVERELRKRGKCPSNQSAIVDRRGKVFCGLKCPSCKRDAKKRIPIEEYEKELGIGGRHATSAPGQSGMVERAEEEHRQGPCRHTSDSAVMDYRQMVSRYWAERSHDCRRDILKAMHRRLSHSLQELRKAFWAGRRYRATARHGMHWGSQAKMRQFTDEVLARVKVQLEELDGAQSKGNAQQLRIYQRVHDSYSRLQRDYEKEHKWLTKETARVGKLAGGLEKASRVAQQIFIKVAGKVVTGVTGNRMAGCLTEAGLAAAAEEMEKWIVKDRTLHLSDLKSSFYKHAALACSMAKLGPKVPGLDKGQPLGPLFGTAAKEVIKGELIKEGLKEVTCKVVLPVAFNFLLDHAQKTAQGLKNAIGWAIDKLGKLVTGKPTSSHLPGELRWALDRVTDKMVREGALSFRSALRTRCKRVSCGLGDGWGRILKKAGGCLLGAVKTAFLSAGVAGIGGVLREAIGAARRGVGALRSALTALLDRYRSKYPVLGLLRPVLTISAASLDLFLQMAGRCPSYLTRDLKASLGRAATCVVDAFRGARRAASRRP